MKLRAYPSHWLDHVVWPFVKFFFRKKSCRWHWIDYSSSAKLTKVAGDPGATGKPGKWGVVVVMHPTFFNEKTGLMQRYNGDYCVGFRADDGTMKLCVIVIPGRDVALLVGKDDVEFFAETFGVNRPLVLYRDERVRRVALRKPRHENAILLL